MFLFVFDPHEQCHYYCCQLWDCPMWSQTWRPPGHTYWDSIFSKFIPHSSIFSSSNHPHIISLLFVWFYMLNKVLQAYPIFQHCDMMSSHQLHAGEPCNWERGEKGERAGRENSQMCSAVFMGVLGYMDGGPGCMLARTHLLKIPFISIVLHLVFFDYCFVYLHAEEA